MEIEYYIKKIYGNDHKYIVSHKHKQAIALISNNTTITDHIEHGLTMLGIKFKQVLPPKK